MRRKARADGRGRGWNQRADGVGNPTADESSRWLTYKSRGSDAHCRRYSGISLRARQRPEPSPTGERRWSSRAGFRKTHTVSASVLEGRLCGRIGYGPARGWLVAFLDGTQSSASFRTIAASRWCWVPSPRSSASAEMTDGDAGLRAETALYLPGVWSTPSLWNRTARSPWSIPAPRMQGARLAHRTHRPGRARLLPRSSPPGCPRDAAGRALVRHRSSTALRRREHLWQPASRNGDLGCRGGEEPPGALRRGRRFGGRSRTPAR